jgi:phospholipid/cholesterol/gamma-HCH transport system ATP-binding protein
MAETEEEIVLQFDNVSLSFDEVRALDHFSLTIRRGDTWVVLGAAGSGKTVLLKVATGLLRPDSGRVVLFGDEITAMKESELFAIRAKVGMLFQESALFDSLTIEENVAYPLLNQKMLLCPREEVHRRVVDALTFVELGNTLSKVPAELSGGMRRRVGIARATVTDPPLAMYDSPTAGLDPITANNIMAFVAKQRDLKHTTSIIVTHRYQDGILMADYEFDPESASLRPAVNGNSRAHQTRFLVMREGRIAFQGSQKELEASTDPYVSKFGRR